MKRMKINEAEVEYEVRGSGEPVLLIGTGPIADSFLPILEEGSLRDHYSLIRYRQRRIDPVTRVAVSFGQHAADAAALLEGLGVSRVHVAGHSTGAAIALQLAIDHPTKVHSLALLEPPLLGVPSASVFLESVSPALAAFAAGDNEAAMAAFLSVVCSMDSEACRTEIDRWVPGGADRAIQDAGNFFESYLPALSAWAFGSNEAAEISQPVLSVVGTGTAQLFVESNELLHSWFTQAETCTIKDAGHLLHLQRPEPVARGLAEFFGRHAMASNQSFEAQKALTT